jgi:hypothetical protein
MHLNTDTIADHCTNPYVNTIADACTAFVANLDADATTNKCATRVANIAACVAADTSAVCARVRNQHVARLQAMRVHCIAVPSTYFGTSLDANTIADAGTDFIACLNARATTNNSTYFDASCNTHTVAFAGTNQLADLVPDATTDGSAMCP